MRNQDQKGFTLIELLVVIAIIGLLASVVLIALNSARAKARDAKRLADVRQLASAEELYNNDNQGSYGTLDQLVTGSYIGAAPTAPSGGTCPAATYAFSGVGSSYTITFCLEGTTGGLGAGSHTVTPTGIQ